MQSNYLEGNTDFVEVHALTEVFNVNAILHFLLQSYIRIYSIYILVHICTYCIVQCTLYTIQYSVGVPTDRWEGGA